MAQRKIVWTETASWQRRSILEYWLQRNQSPTYTLKLLRASNEKTKLIAENPLIYNFSLFYRITADAIIITAFWDNRQDPKKLFELLKTR